jgi:hypothetical protein
VPSVDVNFTEEVLRLRVPNPPEVVSDLLEFAEVLRKICMDVQICPFWLIGVTYFNNHNCNFYSFLYLITVFYSAYAHEKRRKGSKKKAYTQVFASNSCFLTTEDYR